LIAAAPSVTTQGMPATPNEKSAPDIAADHQKAAYHRLVAEHVSDVICLHAPDGTFQFVSPSVREFLGYQPEELVGQSPYTLIHPEDAEEIVRPNHEALLRKQRQMFRCRFRHREGHYCWVEVTNDFVTDETEAVTRLVTSARDISRRKKLEDRVRLFEVIVEKATDAMLVTDPDEKIVYVNPTFEHRTGYTFEEVKGRVPGHFLQGPDTDPEVVMQMREAVVSRRIATFEVLNYTKDETPFWARIRMQPMVDERGQHAGFFALQQDISEERAAREQLKELNRELESFAYVASHDLKEPLRNISGLLDILGEDYSENLNEDGREIVRYAKSAADRLAGMIGVLLEYARTGNPTTPPENVRIGELVEAVRRDLDVLIREQGAEVAFIGEEMAVFGYRMALYRLLQNLVGNSLKHFSGTRSPKVEISLVEKPLHWVIRVADNGPGIPAENRDKIFQLFNRLSRSGNSNGMGLALCRRIVEMHNGRIELVSTDGEGAIFEAHIPKDLTHELSNN